LNCWMPARVETKIVIGTEILEFHFHESFLQAPRDRRSGLVPPAADLGPTRPSSRTFHIVEANLRSDADAPVDRLESRITMKQVKRKAKRLIEESLLASAEKSRAARAARRCSRCWEKEHGRPSKKRVGRSGNVQKKPAGRAARAQMGSSPLKTIFD